MKISIITINYNNGLNIEQTIKSVVSQNYTNIEYLVIDGGSNDNSVEIIEKYDDKITKWISESDKGIYNAMNKGIRMSTGDYLLFLNSGDVLHASDVINDISKHVNEGKDLYYGNLFFKTADSEYINEYPEKLSFSYFFNNRSLPHPGTFIKRSLFDTIFYYNENLKLVSDWEFFLCAICKFNVSYKHLNIVVSDFDLNGLSNNPEHKKIMEKERLEVMINHFPTLLDDMLKLENGEKLLNSSNIKKIIEIDKSKFGRKISSVFLSIFSRIFKNKNL